MNSQNWKKEYITKGQAVNAIVRNHEKMRTMATVNGAETAIKNLKAADVKTADTSREINKMFFEVWYISPLGEARRFAAFHTRYDAEDFILHSAFHKCEKLEIREVA